MGRASARHGQTLRSAHRRGAPGGLAGSAGFTLIEILVVVLIIGILAGIALPVFLSQKSKGADASAKSLAHSAVVASEAIATDNSGSYANVSREELQKYEPSIPIKAGNGAAYISAAGELGKGAGFEVTATATDGHTFTVKREAGGSVVRACTPEKVTGSAGGGCQNGNW